MNAPRSALLASILAILLPAAGLADPPDPADPANLVQGAYTADLVSPAPLVSLRETYAVGDDLAVALDWPMASSALPLSARLKLLDFEGAVVGSVDFTPLYGPQLVWIPGGALAGPTESALGPLGRYVELIASPSQEILLEQGLEVSSGGPGVSVASKPRRPKPAALGSICTLYIDHIRMLDSEDKNGDDVTLLLSGAAGGGYRWDDNIHAVTDLLVNDSVALCDTCNGIQKTIDMDLWDRDEPGWPVWDPHDHLGTVSVSGCSTTPWTTTRVSGSNYTYDFVYRVTCAETTCPL